MRRLTLSPAEVEDEVARLRALGQAGLAQLWRSLTGRQPALGLKGALLRAALAHRLQECALGSLSKEAERRLAALARDQARSVHGAPQASPARRLKPGTRLMREWQGVTHEIVVTSDGYLWQSALYPSLSAIACAITGVSWNGWRFFGLVSRQRTTLEPDRSPREQTASTNLHLALNAQFNHGSAS